MGGLTCRGSHNRFESESSPRSIGASLDGYVAPSRRTNRIFYSRVYSFHSLNPFSLRPPILPPAHATTPHVLLTTLAPGKTRNTSSTVIPAGLMACFPGLRDHLHGIRHLAHKFPRSRKIENRSTAKRNRVACLRAT